MDQVRINIRPHELVPHGRHIQFYFGQAIETHGLLKQIALSSGAVQCKFEIELDRGERTLCVKPEAGVIGRCTLELREIRDTQCKVILPMLALDFCIVPISGKVPSELRVIHAVRVKPADTYLRRLPLGASEDGFLDVVKVEDRNSHKPSELAFDETGQPIEYAAVLAEIERKRAARSGGISELLLRQLESAQPADTFSITVWARISLSAAPHDKERTSGDEQGDTDKTEVETISRAVDQLYAALDNLALKPNPMPETHVQLPYLRTDATAEQIRALGSNAAVGGVFLDDQAGMNDLEGSIALAHSDYVHDAEIRGQGVRVAVWEEGPRFHDHLEFSGAYRIPPVVSDDSTDQHARLTSAIVKSLRNGQEYGHAPRCQLYSANRCDEDALHWAHSTARATVLSQSFHRDGAGFTAELLHDDLVKDYLARREPYLTIVQASGNLGEERPPLAVALDRELANHKSYNSLRVGSHDGTGQVVGTSIHTNPPSNHGDRELPELAAKGRVLQALDVTSEGTSFAAPAVAGVVALIQSSTPELKQWPEGCRAILLAAARRSFARPSWFEDVVSHFDARDGAGNLDAETSLRIAKQRATRDEPTGAAAWNAETLSRGEIDDNKLSTFAYRFQVSGYRAPLVRVALAWNATLQANDGILITSLLTVDLDLCVFDDSGALIADSATFDNNYELAQFRADPARSYEVRIRRWSGTENLWYGIAWATHETSP